MRIGTLIFVTLMLAASPLDDDFAAGLKAFQRQDWPAAEASFARAAETTSDPGLMAFNRGVVALAGGDPAAAVGLFTQTLDDAAIPADRRVFSHYNRGVARLMPQQSVAVYEAAVADFVAVGRSSDAPAELAADARHNLELAKLFLAEAVAQAEADARLRPPPAPTPMPEPPPPVESIPPSEPLDLPSETGTVSTEPDPIPPADASAATPTPEVRPGSLPLPPLVDEPDPPPMNAAVARQWLDRTRARLSAARQSAAKLAATPPGLPHARDW